MTDISTSRHKEVIIMIHTNDKVLKHKVHPLNLAEALGNL